MEQGQRFRRLDVWSRSIGLARTIYELTSHFPVEERFGLVAHLRRAAVSVASNIAEGSVRRSRKEFRHYAVIALGSLAEVETQIEIAADFLVPRVRLQNINSEVLRVRQMLYRLIASLEN